VSIPYDKGNVTLSRVGRGGTSLSIKVKVGKEVTSGLFDLDEFCLEIYSIAFDYYLPLVGSCRVILGKTIPQKETEVFKEEESFILKVINHDHLSKVLSNIKNQLESGSIPRSRLPKIFSQQLKDKQKQKEQESMENDNIMEFVHDNLHPSWDDIKTAAVRLTKSYKERLEMEKEERKKIFMEKKKKETDLAQKIDAGKGNTQKNDTGKGNIQETEEAEEKKKKKKKKKETKRT